MKIRDSIEDTNEEEESDPGKKKVSPEFSIFTTILADIEENPTILQQKLTADFSVFSTIVTVGGIDEQSPTILEKKNKKLKKTRRKRSMKKTPFDLTCTVPQTLTHSELIDALNQELKTLRSETEIKGQTSDQFVSCNPNHDRECDCVEEGNVKQPEEGKFLVDEAIEWLLNEIEPEISTDLVCKVEDGNIYETLDEMLPTLLGDVDDEQVNDTQGCGRIDELIEKMLEEIEKDGSYLDRIKDEYVFGELLENLIRDRLREKSEKEISSWVSNGVETGVVEEDKEVKRDIKEKKKKKMTTPMVFTMERTEQESIVEKRDYLEYKRRSYLTEKLRERHEDLMKRRVKAAKFGVELSLPVAEFMFLIPNEILADETRDYSMCTKLFGFNEVDKGTSVIIGKLQAVFGVVIWKKENKDHNVNLLESSFRYDDFLRLCADAIRALGKIVWVLKKNHCETLKLSDLDPMFEDCQKVLMKIELKLAEMKQRVYRSVSADYESFSKSERGDYLLRKKFMKRVNADNRFGRAIIGPYLIEIWRSLFQAEALQEQNDSKQILDF